MVQLEEITKAEFLQMYAKGEVEEVVNAGDRMYGRTTIGQADNPDGYKVVWCLI